LSKAANKGEIAEMDSLVRQGADPNSVGNEGQTPLVWRWPLWTEIGGTIGLVLR